MSKSSALRSPRTIFCIADCRIFRPATKPPILTTAGLLNHGQRCIELDAMPPPELRDRVRKAILAHVDGDAWERSIEIEQEESDEIASWKERNPPPFPDALQTINLTTYTTLSPFVINQEGYVRVRVLTDEQRVRVGALKIRTAPIPTT